MTAPTMGLGLVRPAPFAASLRASFMKDSSRRVDVLDVFGFIMECNLQFF
jgi:hypothetical protein